MTYKSPTERFMNFVMPVPFSGCWIWMGGLDDGGYGQFTPKRGVTIKAHRFSLQIFKGPIPKGLVTDHLCRVRCCVNPDHLEAVTQKINVIRGFGVTAEHYFQTECHNGHPLTPDNLDQHTLKKKGWRQCLICYRAQKAKYEAKRPKRDRRKSLFGLREGR